MKVLLIHAHENPDSFCAALAKTAIEVLTAQGHEVVTSDLYAMNFNPIAGKHDFKVLSDADYYKYAMEQLHNSKTNNFADDVRSEIAKLNAIDLLLFNFPMWWWSMPAILKGWVDRVLAYGVAYGGDHKMGSEGRFKGSKAMCVITTGSPASTLPPIEPLLKNIHDGIFGLIGFESLEPFLAFSVSRIGQDERAAILKSFKSRLREIN
ncbi:NAD(P)H-dependent oxidoreductase [Maribacter sp.]|nr:NAD(P)H-dependent oxidoreductase [Maribacter sp.]